MIEIEDSIEINVPAEKVFEWLTNLRDSETYRTWHPDHVSLRWIKGEPFREGSVVYAEEYLHGKLHKLKFVGTKMVPNRLIEYQLAFPLSFLSKSSFIIEPTGENSCIFTAKGSMRGGPLYKKLGRKSIEATIRHVKEEGENLKRILESDENR
jgi:uncharacterized protein YndB with AHSA1/START domain